MKTFPFLPSPSSARTFLRLSSSSRPGPTIRILQSDLISRHRKMSTTTTTTFNLPDTDPPIPVHLSADADITQSDLLAFPPFTTWLATLQESLRTQTSSSTSSSKDEQHHHHPFHSSPYHLRSIHIQACDFFGREPKKRGRLGFVKMTVEVKNDRGESLPGAVFLRGGSVAMLIVLSVETPQQQDDHSDGKTDEKDDWEEYVILTVQPRIAAGSLGFVELPAGMLDDSGTFSGAAAKEIAEETGLDVRREELVDMTKLVLESRRRGREKGVGGVDEEEHLQMAVYPSPGGSDEFVPIFVVRKKMGREEVEWLKGRLTGLRGEGEKISLLVVRLEEVWRVAGRDGKTLAALALYDGLRREGRL